MAWFPCNIGGGGSSEIANILKGATEPTSSIGDNGQLYLKYIKGTQQDFSDFNSLNESSMTLFNSENEAEFIFNGGSAIGAQYYTQVDLTGIDSIQVKVDSFGDSYDNYNTPRFAPILIIENTINPASAYPANTSIVSANGETYRVNNVGDAITFNADVSNLTGNYWIVLSSIGATSKWTNLYIVANSSDNVVCDSFAKVNNVWQNLIGTNVDDITYTSNPHTTKDVAYLKWQILKTRNVPNNGFLQIADFYLYQNAEKYSWDSNVSISTDMAGATGYEIANLIDGNSNTKYATGQWGSSQTNECNIVISLGETITLDAHSTYSFCTPNDETSRDPVSWKLYGSTDGTTWELLDKRTDATVPTDRYRETISFPVSEVEGGGGDSPVETKELIYSIDESQGGAWVNSNIDTTQFIELYFRYTDSVSGDDYTAIVKIEDIAVYTGGADVYTTVFPSAVSGLAFNVRIYNNELYVSFNGVGVNTKVVGIYKKVTVKGNATVKQGTFVSATSQFGIVDVDCGFKPDMIMVKLPFTGGDTVSYWEKGLSYAQNSAIWCLKPVENVSYEVALGRVDGETGIQAINDDGFSFMSNGGNTQGVTCEYIAVKYEAEPTPTGDVYTIEQGDTLTAPDETPVNAETDKLYMFFTGNHSGSFTNANVLVGSTSYFEIISGIGIASAIIQATSNTMTYNGAHSGDYYAVEIDVLKNGIEDLSVSCIDRASSWTSGASISANIGDYYLIADTVNNESGTIIGADTLIEETLTHPTVIDLNVKIRIIKATATTISLSSGNNLYYRRFSLLKQI